MLKNKYNIDTVFRKTRTLGNILKHTSREPTDKLNQQHTVYKIPCQCPKAYFGESKRKMGMRLKEHQGQCKLADKTNRATKDTYNDTGLPYTTKWTPGIPMRASISIRECTGYQLEEIIRIHPCIQKQRYCSEYVLWKVWHTKRLAPNPRQTGPRSV